MHSLHLSNAADLARSARTLIKRFVAIELHPAVYVSFIAINVNVLLLTLSWGGLASHKTQKRTDETGSSRQQLVEAYMASKRAAKSDRVTDLAKEESVHSDVVPETDGNDGETEAQLPEEPEAKIKGRKAAKEIDSEAGEGEAVVASAPAEKPKPVHKPARSKWKNNSADRIAAHTSSLHHGGGMLVPPPPPMVPSYLAGEVPAAASIPSEYQTASSDGSEAPPASSYHSSGSYRHGGGHHRRRASYTVESDNFKRVIVER